MSNNPTVGYDGLGTIGSTPVTINKISKWTFDSKRDKTELGPWVGESAKATTIGGKLGTLKLEGDVIIGGDPGQAAILTAYEAGTTPVMVLTNEDGWTLTMTAPAYTAWGVAVDATKGATWSAELEGAYTVVQDT